MTCFAIPTSVELKTVCMTGFDTPTICFAMPIIYVSYILCFLIPYPSRTENGLYMFPYPYPNLNGNALWQMFLPLPQSKWKQSVWQVSPPLSYRNRKSHTLSRMGIRYRFWPIENSPLNLTGRDGRFAWLPYTSSVDVKGSHPSCHHTDPTVLHYSTKTLSLQIMRWWWCGA